MATTHWHWFFALLAMVAFSLLGALIPGLHRNRSHLAIKLFNECLARTTLAYVPYLLSLQVGAAFSRPEITEFLTSLIPLALITFCIGVYICSRQDHTIARHDHKCSDDDCAVRVRGGVRVRLLWFNLAFGLAWFVAGVLLAFGTKPRP